MERGAMGAGRRGGLVEDCRCSNGVEYGGPHREMVGQALLYQKTNTCTKGCLDLAGKKRR
jgi:hypothetical protein